MLESLWADGPAMLFLWRVAPDWPVEFVSENVRQLGYTKKDFLSGRVKWCSITHPEDLPRLEAETAQYLAEGRDHFRQHYRLLSADGHVRWMDDCTQTLRDAEGRITHVQGFIQDVTALHEARESLARQVADRTAALEDQRLWLEREILERKRAEHALRESEERLHLAVRSAPITLFSQDRTLRYTWVFNPPAGIHIEQLIGRTDAELFGDDDPGLAPFKQQVLDTGRRAQREVNVSIGGASRSFNVAAEPLRDRKGAIIGLICAAFEITALKQSQAALAESEARYRAIVETFDGLIYICSDDYQIEFMNQKLIERTGRCAVGEKCHKALHGLDHVCPWCQNERVARGERVRWEVQSPLDGRWYYVVNTPIKRPDGSIAKMAAILDITERKESERQRDSMRQTMQRAQHLESMARLSGNIAHHFNNQLTVVLGNAELAASDLPQESPLQDYLSDIRQAAERAARLSDELLTCSGHAFSSLRPGELNQLVHSCESLIGVAAAPRVEVIYALADPSPCVRMDLRLMQQALLNLVTNSVEVIGDQIGTLRIETGVQVLSGHDLDRLHPPATRTAGPYAFLRVADNGGGLAPEIQARLFDPFASTKGIGRGLGLPLTLGVVTTHHGGIAVESQTGKGCAITIYLPAEEPNCPAHT